MTNNKITKKRKCFSVIVLVIILLTVGMIFFNSLKDRQNSAAQSGAVVEVIKPIVDSENKIPVDIFEHSMRKMAHFSEFLLLALELCVLYTLIFDKLPLSHHIFVILFLLVIVALTDETIQIFSERGSLVVDVWIDLSGGLTACVLYIAGGLLAKFIAEKRATKRLRKRYLKKSN